jgi:FKBP-type peptidyl-prolyl cis-trans isomerase FkpA
MTIRYLTLLFYILTLVSCRNNPEKGIYTSRPGKNEMADLNRYFVQKDKERIQSYIERKELEMKVSPTGLWYQIMKSGEGDFLAENKKVAFDYELSLLDGSKCYSSADLGQKEVIIGRGEMIAGLNEGLRMLKPGAEAIFIIPPFLAYGLIGDGKKIPSRAIIVYKVSIK